MAVSLLVSTLHLIYNIASGPCNFILRGIAIILNLAHGLGYSQTLHQVPLDLRTALKRCLISPITTTYVCCPACCALYPEEGDAYPDECTTSDLGVVCGEALTRLKRVKGKPGTIRKPIRRFVYRHLGPWLAELMCRPGMEGLLDRSVLRTGGDLENITDGEFARDFRGSDGEPFVGRAGRLLLSLSVDWFNPFGKRVAKKQRSIGGLYIALQDLPIALRHRPENICVVGIIPGPSEPSIRLAQVNHFLRPLVDELLELWDPGVYLSSTPSYPNGRHIFVALGQIIADLKACRTVSGFTAEVHTIFCSWCNLHIQDITNFVRTTWGVRSETVHREQCGRWRDATTKAERKAIETAHGVRWTELLRLEYWESSRQTVLDLMHAISGVIETHCRDIWGMQGKKKDDTALGLPEKFKMPNQQSMVKAEEVLLSKSLSALSALRKAQLQVLAYSLGLYIGKGTGDQLAARLHAWVCQKNHPEFAIN